MEVVIPEGVETDGQLARLAALEALLRGSR